MSFFRTLCQDTFDKCFSFTKDPQDNPDYSKVEMSNANGEEILEEDDHKGEDKEYFNDWPTQASIYSTPGMGNEKPQEMPPPVPKKNALIGNYDEDAVYKKKEETKPVQEDTYDDLFGDVAKPTFDQKLTSFGKNNAKQGTKPSAGNKSNSNPPKQAIEKFKMDDEVKAEEGWGDEDYEIKL